MKEENKIKNTLKLNKLKIRRATIRNINQIINIQKRDGFIHAYYLTRKRLRALFKRGEIFFIAFLGDKPVGFASLYIEIRARLHFFSVMKKYTGMEIGSSLLQRVINETKRLKKDMVYVYTEANSPIEQFFIKKDFKKVGYFLNRFGEGKHANIFSFYL
jgi:ribosomal protein S18 acetylase RimI-like enzyme